MKKMKKLTALALTLIMALALTAPALASSPTWMNMGSSDTQTTTFTGTTQGIDIKVAVLSSATLVFNPYKLEAKMVKTSGALDADAADGSFDIVKDQIISKPFEIQNQTNVPLRMAVTFGAKASAAQGAEVATIVKAAPAATVTQKQIFVYADFAVFDGSEDDLKTRPDAWLTAQRLIATEATLDSSNNWDGTSGAKIEIKNNTGGIYIPTPSATPSQGSAKQNSIWVKIGGAATATPAMTWAATDTLNVYTALKFVPQGTAPLYKLYMANYTAGSNGGDPTYTAGVLVGTTAETTNVPTFTVPYKKANVNVVAPTDAASESVDSYPLWKSSAKEERIETGDTEAGYVVTIHPPVNDGKVTHTITTVNFYDENNTKLTTPKAVTTNSKDKTAPWTFTMPAQNVVIDIVLTAVS